VLVHLREVMLEVQFNSISCEDVVLHYKTEGGWCENVFLMLKCHVSANKITDNSLMFFMHHEGIVYRNEFSTKKVKKIVPC
jgi:hypothetical protein